MTSKSIFSVSVNRLSVACCRAWGIGICIGLVVFLGGCIATNGVVRVHTVKYGEDLASISKKYTGARSNYRKIAQYNNISNPNRIKTGQKIQIPSNLAASDARSKPKSSSGSTDRSRTVTEGAIAGTAIGVAAGSLLCGSNRAQCGLLGAIIGAIAGTATGMVVSDKKQEYVSLEEKLDAEIRYAREMNRKFKQHNRQLASKVRQLDSKSKRVKKNYTRGRASKADVQREKKQVVALVDANEELLSAARRDLKGQTNAYEEARRGGSNSAKAKKLKKEIQTLKTNIAKLDRETRQLAQIDERLSV